MNLEDILLQWKNMAGGYRSVEVWDEAAVGYAARPIPTFDDDPFLRFMRDAGALEPDATVLDMGCGAGLYSIALAPSVGRVVGCDLSPKMIEAAREKAVAELGVHCDKTEFVCGDFSQIDFPEPFDIVFAHFTPALCDAASYAKMTSLARKWCFVAAPTRRTDFLLRDLRELVGLGSGKSGSGKLGSDTSGCGKLGGGGVEASFEHRTATAFTAADLVLQQNDRVSLDNRLLRKSPATADTRDENFFYTFAATWLSGKTPTVAHYDDVWDDVRTLEDAKRIYGSHLVAPDLSSEQKDLVERHLESVARDGVVHERIETTVMMMGWHV